MREKENGVEERENEPEIAEGMEDVDEDTQQSVDVAIRGNQEQGLVLDSQKIDALINKARRGVVCFSEVNKFDFQCVAMSKDWSIDEFERLAARITQQIEAYKYSLLYSNVPLAPIFRVSSPSLVTKHFAFDDKHDNFPGGESRNLC